MSLLFETLLIESGQIPLLPYHNERCNRSRSFHFDVTDPIDLKDFIHVPRIYKHRRLRCRIDYDQELRAISYQLHEPRMITSARIVHVDKISYEHKYADRDMLSALYAQRGSCDEVLIVVDGKFTDSYYYNLAFKKGERWLTPNENLLPGTRRHFLLDQGKIELATITVDAIDNFDQICFFNALTPFGTCIIDCKAIEH